MKTYIVALCCLVLTACSSQQMNKVGLSGSTVNAYPQQMSDSELCEIQIYGRSTTQTRVAVAAEYSRRGLNGRYCERLYTSNALTKLYDRFVASETKEAQPSLLPE
ncbi:hypothetical protein [Thaumasiovibrio sp. DFM-14]|uniref:hypothetical protein n=1 Tax=Thaumasiovibrio sp. DFM-14 TaxID=3384792 RepID=UPI0039A325F9